MEKRATAICDLPSDQFRRHSSRTTTGRCRSWTRTQQGENMPILFKTQVNRTAKMPVPARRARVGGLCGFQDTAGRVPTESPKTGRCAAVRELWRKWQARSEQQRETAASPRTSKREKSRDFEPCGEKAARKRRESGEKAGQSRGVVRAPQRSHLPAVRAVSGICEGVPKATKNSPRALQYEKSPSFQGKRRGSDEKHGVNTEKW